MEKLTKQVLSELNSAYLTKYVKEEPKYNPLTILKTEDNIEFEKKLTWLLMQPDYFWFLVKNILNIDLLPFQCVILTEIWQRKFPMLIASRGASKTFLLAVYGILRSLLMPNRRVLVAGAAFRQSRFVYDYMETIWKNAPILRDLCDQESGGFKSPDKCHFNINGSTITCIPVGTGEKIRGFRCQDLIAEEFGCVSRKSLIQTNLGLLKIEDYLSGEAYSLMNIDGKFESPDKIFMTPPVDVYRIKTNYGLEIECSEIHQLMTNNGWKKTLDLTTKDYILLGKNDYFPDRYIQKNGIVLDEKIGWLLGLLISEGNVTSRHQFSISNTDKRLIDKIQSTIDLDWTLSHKEAYIDKRGWNCKECWVLSCTDTEFRCKLRDFGLDYEIHLNKKVPKDILLSPRSVVLSFLSGMYEGDGSAFFTKAKKNQEFQVVLYSSSIELIKTTQQLLLKFGVFSAINTRNSGFNDNHILRTRCSNATRVYNLLDVIKWDMQIEQQKGKRDRKPSILKKRNRYIVSTTVCDKNKYIGSFDSEEECVKAFDEFWSQNGEYLKIVSIEKLPDKEVLYDFHMPETHSFIANSMVQHNSHNREIFETVLAGFGNVSSNPVEAVKRNAAMQEAERRNIDSSLLSNDSTNISNQILLCGTAFYSFNHFADYWRKYRAIINTKGQANKLKEIFPDGVPKAFNWKDYSIIRLPYDALPEGFMDEGNIARSKASVHSSIFNMEQGAVFISDSTGFFKRSLIEACVSSEQNEICLPSGPVCFDAMLKGNPACRYVIGVDPASEIDNFSIVVLELHPDHRRIVHCWTTTRQAHSERVKLGLTTEDNFYSYAARRIRDLMRVFPTERIMLDSQGGGVAVNEALHEAANLKEGELPIWPVIDEDKEKPTDGESGLHIVELVNFAKSEWTSEANHGMRKDFEDKVLLFPKFDPVVLALSAEQDRINEKLYDTLEDCVMEIEEMKNELSLIEITKTPNGRDRWDTPEIKTSQNKKGRMRKDRYSSLLMANMGARQLATIKRLDYESYGGFSRKSTKKENDGADFIGPAWFTEQMKGVY